MGDEDDAAGSVEQFGDGEGDVFHDADGAPVLGDADPTEVMLYAHHCWILGIDPEETAARLRTA